MSSVATAYVNRVINISIPKHNIKRHTQLIPPPSYLDRLQEIFKDYIPYQLSDPHIELAQWVDSITADTTPRPFCAFWSRGRGKSTHAELAAVDLGARGVRKYCLYVCATQDQADKHIQTIARIMENDSVARYFPEIGKPRISKNGNRTWNRSMVTCANGYTAEAIGLNKAVRGQKVDWARIDFILKDDVDDDNDSQVTIDKKEKRITSSILPAGSSNCAVLFVQNLIHSESIASKFVNDTADYLHNRIVSGPYPAVRDLQYEAHYNDDGEKFWKITGGTSVWRGFTLDICETEINRVGVTAYEKEFQHEVDNDDPEALLTAEDFNRTRVDSHPDLSRVVVGVDPPGSIGQCGIVCTGKANVNKKVKGYTLEDATTPPGVSSNTWALAVLKCYYRNNADCVVAEKNNGGDMVRNAIQSADWRDDNGELILSGNNVPVVLVHASRGKVTRAEPVAILYENNKAHMVGSFPELEKQWRKYKPGDVSPDRLDAHVWTFYELGLVTGRRAGTW